MKKQVLFIHGGDSFGQYDDFIQDLSNKTIRDPFGLENKSFWTQTLREDLGEKFEVLLPQMPNKQNAQYEEWKIWLERYFEFLRDGVNLIGWSLGGMFLAKYLSENKFPYKIKSLYLLSAPSGEFVLPDFDKTGNDCKTFKFSMNNLVNLSKQVEKVTIWHSEDDFIVPYTEFEQYKKYLSKADFFSFKDKNHFLVTVFPELITQIKNNS